MEMPPKRKPAKLRKSAFTGVNFTEDEKAQLRVEAAAEFTDLSGLIRKRTLDHPDRAKHKRKSGT